MHNREKIINEIAAMINATPNVTTFAIQQTRPFSDAQLPAQNIIYRSENATYDEYGAMGQPAANYRTLQVGIEFIEKNTDYSRLDDFCEDIEQAILANSMQGTNYISIEIDSTEYEFNAVGDSVLQKAVVTFNVNYRVADGVPQTAIN